MKKHLLRTAMPCLVCLGLGVYLGRRHAPVELAGQRQSLQAQTAPGSAGAGKSPGKPGGSPTGVSEVFVGTADAFLKALSREPDETEYLLYNTVQHTSLETLISWAHEVAAMPSGRLWQSQLLTAIGKRWGAADPAAAMDWAQSLPNPGPRKQALAAIMGGIARQDPAAALARLGEMPEGAEKSQAITGIAHEIAKKDPRQALELIKGNTSYEAQHVMSEALGVLTQTAPQEALKLALDGSKGRNVQLLSTVFIAWVVKDPAAALVAVGELPNIGQRSIAGNAAMNSWAMLDPAAALAHLSTAPESQLAYFEVGNTLGMLSKDNPTGALAAFAKLPASFQEKEVEYFSSQFSYNNPSAAFAWAATLTNPAMRNSVFKSIGRGLYRLDPTKCDALIASVPAGKHRNDVIQYYIETQVYNDPVVAAKMLLKLDPQQQARSLKSSLLNNLATKDPELALQLATQAGGTKAKNHISELFSTLVETDYAGAEKLLAKLNPSQQSEVLPQLYGKLATTDGVAAMAKASAIADKETQKKATQSVISKWANQDPDAVLQWAQNAPQADRSYAQYYAFSKKLSDDATSALPAVNALLQSPPVDAESTSRLKDLCSKAASQLYQADPKAAAQWASQLGNESYRYVAVKDIARQWASEDPVEASVWVQGLPAGKSKDTAVGYLIQNIQESDPAAAFAWATSIGDSSSRQSSVSQVYREWKAQDPAAAAQALQAAPIDAELRGRLLQPEETP